MPDLGLQDRDVGYHSLMSRTQAIALIQSSLTSLPDEITALADIAAALCRKSMPEDEATLAALKEGGEQADRGEFATETEVEDAVRRFRA